MPRLAPQLDSVFRDRVYELTRLIPYAEVATYGQIATLCGMPRMARHVGWALHTLPRELAWGVDSDARRGHAQPEAKVDADNEKRLGRVPWHRVINAQGRVSSHPDDAGTRRQIELLREEGIEVSDDGALAGGLAAHRWAPEPALVDGLELPAEVLFELDRQLNG